MISADFYDVLMKITTVMQEKGEGISYIKHESDTYTLGTRIYSAEIAAYLDKTLDNWEGSEADLKKRKKRGKKATETPRKVGYLWKIPLNNEL
ncbi:hypothetical protein [Methanobacterium sp. ACI-7]|uniref:hypothetical protein n=1 Tax=unclassified Methanobacterium TaxID=2627676 RepID=UPI0039C2FA04